MYWNCCILKVLRILPMYVKNMYRGAFGIESIGAAGDRMFGIWHED